MTRRPGVRTKGYWMSSNEILMTVAEAEDCGIFRCTAPEAHRKDFAKKWPEYPESWLRVHHWAYCLQNGWELRDHSMKWWVAIPGARSIDGVARFCGLCGGLVRGNHEG